MSASFPVLVGSVTTEWLLRTFPILPGNTLFSVSCTTVLSGLVTYLHQRAQTSTTAIKLVDDAKRILGLQHPNAVEIDSSSVYYRKIISYLLDHHKHVLQHEALDINTLTNQEILTKIKFHTNCLSETFQEKHRVSIWLVPSSHSVLIECKTMTIPELKKFIHALISKNISSSTLNLYLPTIIRQGDKKKSSEEEDKSSTKKGKTEIEWNHLAVQTNKNLANTVLSRDVQTNLVDDLYQFLDSEEYYNQIGTPYKRGYLLTGPPGSGKTSIIKALAATFGFDVYSINMETVLYPEDLTLLFQGFHASSSYYIVCFEDIDRCPMFQKSYFHNVNNNQGIRTFLNELDGIAEGNKRISFFTANCDTTLKEIEALIRPGRIDKIVEMTYCDLPQLMSLYYHYTRQVPPQAGEEEEGGQTPLFSEEELKKLKITPATISNWLLMSPSMTKEELKEKVLLRGKRSREEGEDGEKEDGTVSSGRKQVRKSSRCTRYCRKPGEVVSKIEETFQEEDLVVNELVEAISVCSTMKEIQSKLPNILWGRQTRLKRLRKNLEFTKEFAQVKTD
jgi:SpoVK/Ycf46/Vps4 family AAA+-type ATPase